MLYWFSLAWIFSCQLIPTSCNDNLIHYSAANTSLMRDTKNGLHFAYFAKLQNFSLSVAPIKVFHVKREQDCLISCVANLSCVSLNFAKLSDSSGQYQCELLAADMFRNRTTLMPNASFHYFIVKVRYHKTKYVCLH